MKTKILNEVLGYQQNWLRDTSRFKIGLWARQTGKDYTCAAEAVFDCVQNPKTHWLILACGERQARESLEKAKEWALTAYEKHSAHLPRVSIKRESATEIRFANGSRITALPAKPGTIRGYSANIILTEFAFHDDPEAMWKAIFPTVSNSLRGGEKKVRIISTPNGQGNFFHELWTNSKIFRPFKTTIHDAKKAGLQIDLEALKAGLLDTEAWAQEYECEFADQSSVLLPYELIEPCEVAEATQTSSPDILSRSFHAEVHHTPEIYLGIDFGRKQDLTVCWVLEKLRPNLNRNPNLNPSPSFCSATSPSFMTREVLVLRRTPTPAQIEALRPRVRLARKVCVDYTGAGVGLGDALKQEFGSKVELCTFTTALKEEIFVKLRAGFERRALWIPKNTEIREDLHSVHRVVSNSGQISYRASRTADGHSDRCTALALALRAGETATVIGGASNVGRRLPFLAGY